MCECEGVETRVPFGRAQGRLSAALRFAKEDEVSVGEICVSDPAQDDRFGQVWERAERLA